MRVYVYAISKNEEKHARRWMASMAEADGVYVLDTGSTDDTPAVLRELGAHVSEERIEPWRFDTARNRSMELLPEDADICVCTDLDEVFRPGWRKGFERVWKTGARMRARYLYAWSHNADGSDGVAFWSDKVHSRHGFRWVGAVHEVLSCDGHCEWADAEDVKLDHWPDGEKSRAQYLPLLELAVREDPTNDRNMHYLGREYMFRGEYEKAIDTLRWHLALPGALWQDERCASMRFIARCCAALGQGEESERWRMRAAAEAPHLREPWLDWAKHAYAQEDWPAVLFCCTRALAIAERPRSYISEPESWGEMPHDLCCIANFRLGRIEAALQQARFAEQLAPQEERIRQNRIVLEEMAGQGVDSGAPDMVP